MPISSVSSVTLTAHAGLPGRPLDTAQVLPGRLLRRVYRLVQLVVERAFGFPELWRLYEASRAGGATGPTFVRALLAQVRVTWVLPAADTAVLRALKGPIVVVANHPHGGLDALVLMALLDEVRPRSWRLLANGVMCAVPELADGLIAVDPLGTGPRARKANAAGMAQALRHLRSPDAVLALFPAGRVSHRQAGLRGAVCDRPWTHHAVRLAAHAGATLVCLHLPGAGSRRFLAIPPGLARLRALMLARELVHPPTSHLAVRVAAIVPPGEVCRWMAEPQAAARLRARCYMLADREAPREVTSAVPPPVPLCDPVDPEEVACDVERLMPDHRLLGSSEGAIDVLLFAGERAPVLLRALGRAREFTFRASGQGSGLACDLAPEDDVYQHLVLWHRTSRAVIGAYRLGFTRELLSARGPRGLYLDRCFEFDARFHPRLGPSIELSRSFVLPSFQRDNRALGLLWRGLGAAALRHGCTTFYGCVSISNQHHPATRALIVEQLQRNHADAPEWCDLVRARRPFKPATTYHSLVGEAYAGAPLEALAPLVASPENGARGIPPLIRYYCSLGARFLAYHVEPTFNHALYCLLRVDLRTIPDGYRRRFLG